MKFINNKPYEGSPKSTYFSLMINQSYNLSKKYGEGLLTESEYQKASQLTNANFLVIRTNVTISNFLITSKGSRLMCLDEHVDFNLDSLFMLAWDI